MPAMPLADAHSGRHRGSRRSPKDSRLPRFAIAAPSGGSGSPQRTTHTHRILTANRPPSPTCVGTLPSFPSRIKNPVFKSMCGQENLRTGKFLFRMPEKFYAAAASLRTLQRKTAFDSPRLYLNQAVVAYSRRSERRSNSWPQRSAAIMSA